MGQAKLYTSRRDAYDLINTEVGLERFTDSCRLGLLVDLVFSEKLRECLGQKTPEQKRMLLADLSWRPWPECVPGGPGGLNSLYIIPRSPKDFSVAF